MASYAQRGLPNEYSSNLNVNTYPDSDESDFSDSEAEHASLLHGRHTVALDGNLEESDVQRGLYNRHNFLVNNYNNVLDHNYMQLRVVGPRMSRLAPFGGIRSRHLTSRFDQRNFENLVILVAGWLSGCIPPLFMVFVAYSNRMAIEFVLIYTIFTLLILHLVSICLLVKNTNKFLNSPFMVPVLITSSHLKGLQNNFKDISVEEFKDFNVSSSVHTSLVSSVVNYMTLINEEDYTVRVMFYSVEYYEKYISVPRNRIIQLILLTVSCLGVSLTVFIRQHKHPYTF